MPTAQGPTSAFIAASWAALACGIAGYLGDLWLAHMQLNEKGYYLTLLLYGLFAAVSLQKTVRDRGEGIAVTKLYVGLCWFSLVASVLLLAVGLANATLDRSEKGFLAIAYLLSLFAVTAVQKNVRDLGALPDTMTKADPA